MFRVAVLILIASVATSGCTRRAAGPLDTLESAAEGYVRLTLALAERDPDALDAYTGPSAWRDEARTRRASLPEIERDASRLADRLQSATFPDEDPARHAFLIRHLRAVAVRSAIVRGAAPPFADEARELYGITRRPAPIDPAPIHAALDRLLPGRGDLAARYGAFDRGFLVPPDRLPAVLTRAIAACRDVTRAHVALPASERLSIEYVGELPWSAFTRHDGRFASRVQVNAAYPLTVDRALDLACHEGYPGHHTLDALAEMKSGTLHRPELFVRLMYSPEMLIQEGAASLAPDLAFSAAAREQVERDQLFPAAGLDPAAAARYVHVSRLVDRLHPLVGEVAWRYLDGELEFARAADALTREALMPSPDPTLKFLNQYRSYGLVYTIGRDIVARIIDARAASEDDGDRWRAYVEVATGFAQK